MSPTPFVVSGAAAAVKGAAAGAAKIAASEKAAKALASAFGSIEQTTKMGGFQALENFSQNIKNSGPVASALEVITTKFVSGTMASQINLMKSLLVLFENENMQQALLITLNIVNAMINSSAAIIDLFGDVFGSDPPEGGYGGGGGGAPGGDVFFAPEDEVPGLNIGGRIPQF